MAGYFPSEKMAFVLTSNGSSINLNDIALVVLATYFNNPFELPTYEKEIIVNNNTLNLYEGVYTSDNFPLDITIRNEEGALTAQATGQSSFPLTPTSQNVFIFKPGGITVTFKDHTLSLEQGEMVYEFAKQ